MNGNGGVALVQVLGFGPDTLALNVRPVDEDGTPVRCELDQDLQAELTLLKEPAQREDASIPTRWVFCREQLFIREKGAQAGFKWVLECPKLIVTVGRGVKTGLWAQARLSSEYLWWCGDLLLAIAHVEEFLEHFFGRRIHLQPSSFDLAADCTGWDVSTCDVKHEFVFRPTSTDELPDTDGLLDGPESIKRRWERIVGLPFGQRASAVSCLIYDKTHEIRYHAQEKGWFRDLWLAQRGEDGLPSWDGEAPVWRVEFRFKRQALAEFGIEDVCDLLEHVNDLWMYAAGHVDGGDDNLPDGWLRYVVPVHDLNRSRWPVHPAWRAIQGACVAMLVRPGEPVPSTSAALDLEPFIRRRKREVNLQRALAAAAGYVSTIEAWRPALDGGGSDQVIEPDISDTFHFVFENVIGYLDEKERDFSQLVHKKRVLYRLETLAALWNLLCHELWFRHNLDTSLKLACYARKTSKRSSFMVSGACRGMNYRLFFSRENQLILTKSEPGCLRRKSSLP